MSKRFDPVKFQEAIMNTSNVETAAMWLDVTDKTFRRWALRFFFPTQNRDWRAMEQETGVKI